MKKTPIYPRITIITPSYNQGHFIEETITSVLNQGYPNLEYWVIDGGSTDNTKKILQKYDKKIHWVSEKDRGQTDAINKGVKRATGEIIAYLNSDDVMLPNTLFTVAEHFQSHPESQWLTGDYFIIDAEGNKIQSYVATYKRVLRERVPTFATLSVANCIIQPSTFWRASVMEEIGMFDESLRYCMDFDYWMRLIQKYPPAVTKQHFSLFRIHGASKGGAQYVKQFAEEHALVCKYTDNMWLRFVHKLHSMAIVAIYKLIK